MKKDGVVSESHKQSTIELEIPQRIILNLFDNKPKRAGTIAKELKRTESIGKIKKRCNTLNRQGVLKREGTCFILNYKGFTQELCNLAIKPNIGIHYKRMPNKKEMQLLVQLLKTEFYKFYITTDV